MLMTDELSKADFRKHVKLGYAHIFEQVHV